MAEELFLLKKLVVPLAIVSFSLFACSTDMSQESPGSSVANPNEIMNQIAENDNVNERPIVSLDFNPRVE